MSHFLNISFYYRLFLRNIPNAFTLSSTTLALLGLHEAIHHLYYQAVLYIFVAAIMDGLDGRAARLLNQHSTFGMQLDSFSDMISFGIVPALINYFWILNKLDIYGFIIVIIYTLCSMLRLVKFNVNTSKSHKYSSNFFYGLPMPMAAGFSLYPLIFIALTQDSWSRFFNPTILLYSVATWVLLISLLMISSLPLFSFKKTLSWKVLIILLITGIIFHNKVWFVILIGVLLLIYVLLIPVSFWYHKKRDHRKIVTS